jgi:hypothetical protein
VGQRLGNDFFRVHICVRPRPEILKHAEQTPMICIDSLHADAPVITPFTAVVGFRIFSRHRQGDSDFGAYLFERLKPIILPKNNNALTLRSPFGGF